MKSNKIFVLIVFVMISTVISFGQQPRFSKEAFKKKRSEFLKKELDLTPSEASKFLPMSEELMEKKFELNKGARETARSMRNKSTISDAEYEKVIDTWVDNRVKEALLEKEYYEKFKKVLPMRKLRKYQEVDMKFMRGLMDQRQGSRTNRSGN